MGRKRLYQRKEKQTRLCQVKGCDTVISTKSWKYCQIHRDEAETERHHKLSKHVKERDPKSYIPHRYWEVPDTKYLQPRDWRQDVMTLQILENSFFHKLESKCADIYRITVKRRRSQKD